MTLVPIIYTSLLIFTAFLFLVIAGSYISFRAKKVRNPKAELKIQKPKQSFPKPVLIPVQQTQKQAVIIQQQSVNMPTTHLTRRRIPTMERNQAEENNKLRHSRYINSRTPEGTKVILPREERINVINDSNKFIERVPVTQIERRVSYNKLPDLNLLNYYSDRSDSKFITLTA